MAVGGSSDPMLRELLSFPRHPPAAEPCPDEEYDASIRRVVDVLGTTPAAKLATPGSRDDSILDTVDPAIHSLPYEYALVATARAENGKAGIVPGTPLYERAATFLQNFDPVQVRYGGAQFKDLLHLLLKGAKQATAHFEPVTRAVIAALQRLDPSGSTLTSTHVAVAEMCLRARAFDTALLLLDKDIFHLPAPTGQETTHPPYPCSQHQTSAGVITEKSGLTNRITYQDYLKYFLYGGSVYIAKKNWNRAVQFLEIVLAAPVVGYAFSMIQVEAYKRWCLVQLLLHGRAGQPRNMTQAAAKHCQNLAKAYVGVAEKFKLPDTAKLQAEIEAGPFRDDCNYGLAMFVLAAHRRFKVSKLAQTYMSLTVREVAKGIGYSSSDETELYLQNLIRNGEIDAELRPVPSGTGDGLLIFKQPDTDSLKWNHLVGAQALAARRVIETKQHMKDTQRRVELSKDYLVALKRQRRLEGTGKDGKGAIHDDEDVFEDL